MSRRKERCCRNARCLYPHCPACGRHTDGGSPCEHCEMERGAAPLATTWDSLDDDQKVAAMLLWDI